MSKPERTCLTSGAIAKVLRQPVHRVAYILRTREHIQPLAKAGNARVYTETALAQVRYELNRIDAVSECRGSALTEVIT